MNLVQSGRPYVCGHRHETRYNPIPLAVEMAKSQQWQRIPTQLSVAQLDQFVFPHLILGSRGPAPKLGLHSIFNYILVLASEVYRCRKVSIAKIISKSYRSNFIVV